MRAETKSPDDDKYNKIGITLRGSGWSERCPLDISFSNDGANKSNIRFVLNQCARRKHFHFHFNRRWPMSAGPREASKRESSHFQLDWISVIWFVRNDPLCRFVKSPQSVTTGTMLDVKTRTLHLNHSVNVFAIQHTYHNDVYCM